MNEEISKVLNCSSMHICEICHFDWDEERQKGFSERPQRRYDMAWSLG